MTGVLVLVSADLERMIISLGAGECEFGTDDSVSGLAIWELICGGTMKVMDVFSK